MLVLLPLMAGLASAMPLDAPTAPVQSGTATPSDPCALLVGTGSLFATKDMLACLQSIAFKPEVRTNVMGVAEAMYSLDVLAANQLGNPVPSLNQGIDIQQEFGRINATTSYSSDFDFQSDLSRSLASLNDGHYAWKSCYTSLFEINHAIPIVSLASKTGCDEPDIHIVSDVAAWVAGRGFTEHYASAGLNASILAGAQVLSVNGKHVLDYIEQDVVPVAGRYTDKQQRVNSVFASYTGVGGVWSRLPGKFTSSNDWTKDNLTMTVNTTAGVEAEITVPWVVSYSGTANWTFANGEEFWKANCSTLQLDTNPDDQGPTGVLTPPTADLNVLAQAVYAGCPASSSPLGLPLSAAEDPLLSAAYLGGRDVLFFALPNTTTGVAHISTFAPSPASDTCLIRFFVDIVLGLRNLTAAGVENLLIDTSNNGGGATALSQIAQVLFAGKQFENEANFQSVLRQSPLSEAFLQRFLDNPSLANVSSSFNPAEKRNGSTPFPSTTDYFSPGREYSINNRTLRTSNLLQDSTAQLDVLASLYNISQVGPFPPANIVFTGNGLCGSACATFTNFFIEYHNGTGYIQAAQPTEPIEFQAYNAGQAFTSDAVYQEALAIGFNDTSLLPVLNSTGSFGFALRAVISPNVAPGEFLQYRSFPAANRFALTEAYYKDQIAAWTYVADKAFPRK